MADMEKLVEAINDYFGCDAAYFDVDPLEMAQHLLANGVVVQDDIKEMLGRGLENLYWRIYGANKEFNDRMSAYNPSAFCAGFEYAIQLAKGLLTQLPQPPKEVE